MARPITCQSNTAATQWLAAIAAMLLCACCANWLNSGSSPYSHYVQASPNIFHKLSNVLFGETGELYGRNNALDSCQRLQPTDNLVRTYLWRIARRRDIVKTEKPSYIFGFPGETAWFSRNDPYAPFTCRHAQKAFENAHVLVQGVPLTNRYKAMNVAARMPLNLTVYEVLPADVVDEVEKLWKQMFFTSTLSSAAQQVEWCAEQDSLIKSTEWRDKAPLWLIQEIDRRKECLAVRQAPTQNSASAFVNVDIAQMLAERARVASKQRLSSEWVEEYAQVAYHMIPRDLQARILATELSWRNNTAQYEPVRRAYLTRWRKTNSMYLCGNLTKPFLNRQCALDVQTEAVGASLELIKQGEKSYCEVEQANRAETVADRLDNMIRFQPTKSFFYVMFLNQFPMDDDLDDDNNSSSVMAKLRQRGYQVDELYVQQNNSREKFLY